jgi:hypothetical protein
MSWTHPHGGRSSVFGTSSPRWDGKRCQSTPATGSGSPELLDPQVEFLDDKNCVTADPSRPGTAYQTVAVTYYDIRTLRPGNTTNSNQRNNRTDAYTLHVPLLDPRGDGIAPGLAPWRRPSPPPPRSTAGRPDAADPIPGPHRVPAADGTRKSSARPRFTR